MIDIKLSITIDGEEVFGTNGIEWLMCGENHKETVLSALSESMVMVCGCLPKPDDGVTISHERKSTPIFQLVPR